MTEIIPQVLKSRLFKRIGKQNHPLRVIFKTHLIELLPPFQFLFIVRFCQLDFRFAVLKGRYFFVGLPFGLR